MLVDRKIAINQKILAISETHGMNKATVTMNREGCFQHLAITAPLDLKKPPSHRPNSAPAL